MVAASTTKNSSATTAASKSPTQNTEHAATIKSHHASHPSYVDMITECITTSPDGTRNGVSRPTLKKFVESKYHLPMNSSSASQLNRAITQGAEKGHFILPKGPSGKVKLAPKGHHETTKENTKPASKRSAGVGEHAPAAKPATRKAAQPRPVKSSAAKPIRTTTKATTSNIKKYTSSAKKAKTIGGGGRKLTGKKTMTARRGAAKAAVTGGRPATRKKNPSVMRRGKRGVPMKVKDYAAAPSKKKKSAKPAAK
ncbi:hypothetical protein BV22DRAFT_1028037 [Leucogyrophana mollusca]|uniref:Uncharacterized protein n=1 Tax=Leucogyrophana mollusca TaxID=85980 RepID=A0ACB8BYV3_9AGAM|nr:hypothetical protein BV22DRAFT_1028037 [Leucogyrophana mollusca]